MMPNWHQNSKNGLPKRTSIRSGCQWRRCAALFSGFQYEVLLLDWTLPGVSGLDVCKSYRKSGGLANIIFLTGRGDITDKEEALNYGADDYVTKPFDIRELAARVRSVLRRPYTLLPNELTINGPS
jgi:DNA-binding response OmpR family regulator